MSDLRHRRNRKSARFSTGGLLSVLLVSLLLLSCGDDGGGPRSEAPQCVEGFGECGGSELCVSGNCLPIQGRQFRITVENGQFPEAREYYVELKYRGQDLLMRTPTTSSTRTPNWYESTTMTLQGRTDWWTLEVRRPALFGSSLVLSCQLDFSPPDFELSSSWTCGESSQQLRWTIEPR